MKILFGIKSLNVVGGGAERVLVDVAGGLAGRGHEVSILTFDHPGESFYPLHPSITRLDMAFNQPGVPTPGTAFLKAIPRIRRAVHRTRADVFVPFMHSTAIPLTFAVLGLGQRIVFSEHIDFRHYEERPKQYALLKLFRRVWRMSTVPSQTARNSYPVADRDHMQVIPNPLDMAQWQAGVAASVDRPVLLSVGRLMEQKDHPTLLEAFARLSGAFPEWSLRILGDGPMREDLSAQVARLGLGDRVEMPGTVKDVASEYAAARFVVLPSRYESFGMVAAEALASERAVLCFDDCAGITELVDDGRNGVLVRGSPDSATRVGALAEGLERLMGDPDLCARLGKAGPQSLSGYKLESVLDRWEALLSGASGNSQRGH